MELHISKMLNGFFNNISRSQFETIMSQNRVCFRYTTPRRAKVEVTMDDALSAMLLTNASNIAGTIGFGMAFDYSNFTQINGLPTQSLLDAIEQSTIDVKMLFLSIFDKTIKEKGRALKNLFGSLVNFYHENAELNDRPMFKAILETTDDKVNYVLDGRDKISRRLVSLSRFSEEVSMTRTVDNNFWKVVIERRPSSTESNTSSDVSHNVNVPSEVVEVDNNVCPICGERLINENRLNFFGELMTICTNQNCANSYGPLSMRFNSVLKDRDLVEKVGIFDSRNILFQLKVKVSGYSDDLSFIAIDNEVVANFVSQTEIITRPISLKKKTELLNTLTNNGLTVESVKVLKMTNVNHNDVTVIKSLIERGVLVAPTQRGQVRIDIDTMEVTVTSSTPLNVNESFDLMFDYNSSVVNVKNIVEVDVAIFEGGAC